MQVPVALLCKLTWNLDMGHTSKQAFSKIHFPICFSTDTGSLPPPRDHDLFPLNLKSDRKYAGVSAGETRDSGMASIEWALC